MTTQPMADTIGIDLKNIPAGFPKVAYYVTGGGSIQAPQAEIDRLKESGHLRIDQSPQLQAYAVGKADVADVEPGAGTSIAFVAATKKRIAAGMHGNLYCDKADMMENVNALLDAKVDLALVVFWVADWDLDAAQASKRCGTQTFGPTKHGNVTINVGAVQWASPTSNPNTTIPGTKLTLKDANVDLSETVEGWFSYRPPAAAIMTGLVVTPELHVIDVASTDGGNTWQKHG